MDRSEEMVTNRQTGGSKARKLARFDLLPADALVQVAEHFGKGANKYTRYGACDCDTGSVSHASSCGSRTVVEPGDRNWEKGYPWSLSFGAMMRHAWLFWDGEDLDSETASHHITAVAWHALVLLTFARTHKEFDDRPRPLLQDRDTPLVSVRGRILHGDDLPPDDDNPRTQSGSEIEGQLTLFEEGGDAQCHIYSSPDEMLSPVEMIQKIRES